MMNKMITAETTDEQIMAPVLAARKSLQDVLNEQKDSEYLLGERMVRAAQAVRDAEAVSAAAFSFRNVVAKKGDDNLILTQSLMGLLVRGADDTWSGRGNDSNRSAHDAVRRFAEDQFDHIRYGNQG